MSRTNAGRRKMAPDVRREILRQLCEEYIGVRKKNWGSPGWSRPSP